MDKRKLKGLNLGRVFHSRLSFACIGHAVVHITKQPNLNLKTEPKQLLGSLLLTFALPGTIFQISYALQSILGATKVSYHVF
jgi:hypothetical protein